MYWLQWSLGLKMCPYYCMYVTVESKERQYIESRQCSKTEILELPQMKFDYQVFDSLAYIACDCGASRDSV